MTPKHTLLLTSSLLLSACGFHLKGQADTPPTIRALYLECACDDTLAAAISNRLQSQGIQLISAPGADLAVSISDPQQNTRDTAIGDSDRSKEVELSNSIHVRISKNGTTLSQQRIQSSAYIQYNSDTYLGNSSEANEARARLTQENTDKLIRYLSTVNNNQP